MDYKSELINLAYKFARDDSTCSDIYDYIEGVSVCESCELNDKINNKSDITFCQVLIGIHNGIDGQEDYEDEE